MTSFLPMVSIIIVNWNGKRFLETNLSSVYAQTFQQFEVILIDNGSIDGSVELVRVNFTDVIIIENIENFGLARANNQGIEIARGRYIATLNNDTEVDRDWLKNLAEAAESSGEKVGMWAPKILSMQERARIDSVGGLLIYRDGIARGRGRSEEDKGQYDRMEDILFPSACSALYRKDMLNEIGYFDEDFVAYCEDSDLGFRARFAGWNAVSVPDAVVYHHYSGSTGRYSETKAFLVERNHLWLAIKNFPVTMLAFTPFYTLWCWLVQATNLISGKGATSKYVREVSPAKAAFALINALISAVKGLPAILGKRMTVQKKRVMSSREVGIWFKKYGLSSSGVVDD